MKTCLFLVLMLLFACKIEEPQPASSISTEEIYAAKNLIQGSFDHIWGGLDSTKISEYHTDDFIILEQGEIWTNQEIKSYINRSLKRENRPLRINKIDYISIEKNGDAINLAYHNYASFMQGDSLVGKARWLESALAVKGDEGWKLKMMHSTRVNVQE
jgi:hypothetical protein